MRCALNPFKMEALTDFHLWVISALAGIVGWGLKEGIQILKDIRNQLAKMNDNLIRHEQTVIQQGKVLDDHETRIRKIEENQ